MTASALRRRAVATVTAAAALAAVAPVAAGTAPVPTAGPRSAADGAPLAAATPTTQPSRPSTTARSTTGAPGATPTTAPGARDAARRQVDVLRADRAAVRSELDERARRVEAAEAELLAVAAAVEEATAAADALAAQVASTRELAAAAREQVREYAVSAFIRPPAQDALAVLAIGQAADATYVREVLGIMAEGRRDVVVQMARVEQVVAAQESEARAAADAAAARRDEVRNQVAELERLRSEQAAIVEELDSRLDSALAESAALAAIDERAAEELAAREAALRAQAPPAPARRTAPTTTPPRRSPAPAPTTTVPRSSPSPSPSPPAGTVGWTDVTKVGGIWVHKSIASNVRGLLDAATAAGFSLGGGGFRDPAEQVTLRRAHCGPTEYDIWQKPASQCHPPTARPGTSMHERGLALDLMSSGKLITSRADPAFVWLKANAARFGFYNLPSEPWHWSTNGN